MEWEMVDLVDSEPEIRTVGLDLCEMHEQWEAVGPFPSGMREHALTKSPLHAYAPEAEDGDLWFARLALDEKETWPSGLPTSGRAGWKTFERGSDGSVDVVYPDVNWNQLRSDHGWAALQYETILRSHLDISLGDSIGHAALLVDSSQIVEYAFVSERQKSPVTWYNGDIYDFANTPTGRRNANESSNFARSIALKPGRYTVLVRVIYEIRMFGDPGDKPPTINFKLDTRLDHRRDICLVPGLDVVPDMVDGRMMGDWLAVGVQVPASGRDVFLNGAQVIEEISHAGDVEVIFHPESLVRAGQTRRVPLRLRQTLQSKSVSPLRIRLTFAYLHEDPTSTTEILSTLELRTKSKDEPFRFTFDPATDTPEGKHTPPQIGYAIAVPPSRTKSDVTLGLASPDIPVTLALHGAGVDVEWPTWIDAMPKTGGWAVLPTGKNEWGEDWHGASMIDAWAARDALPGVLGGRWGEISDKTLTIGHSNGGQGAWHLASRYPDRVVGVIGAAGYVKVQDYVPYTETVSLHYADPSLLGILNSSLTPYNNDLYLSNLAHVPCLALHGGADTNVPPRHSRTYASLISAWSKDKDAVEVVEVKGKDHWWDGMMDHPRVVDFFRRVIGSETRAYEVERKKGFTLTTSCVEETGYKAGVRISELIMPGRLGRLDVYYDPEQDQVRYRATNVKRIDVVATSGQRTSLAKQGNEWIEVDRPSEEAVPTPPVPRGPMIRFLSSRGPISFVCGASWHFDLASRLAQDLLVYHRLDSEIIRDVDAHNVALEGNVVIIGRPEDNAFLRAQLGHSIRTPVSFPSETAPNTIAVSCDYGPKMVYEEQAGIIALLPHPKGRTGTALLISGNSQEGTEAAARLFPLRTGVPIPDWVVVGPKMAYRGAGGIIGAGFWSYGPEGQSYNPVMSWFDR